MNPGVLRSPTGMLPRPRSGFNPLVEVPLHHTMRSKAVGAIAGAGTVPQVFVNGRLIGGSADLEAYLRKAA